MQTKLYKTPPPKTINDIDREEDLFLINEYRVLSEKGQEEAKELFRNGKTIQELISFCKKYTKQEYANKLKEKPSCALYKE